ncbi:PAS domain S-box protein [uncultured Methanospirillum sp.]|uniref:PAS domain S-box protein n=1 Tax=uncultured Methanospirillum sp. TaxID=262503 RepID=UPI0029C96A6A|nr:PAS domain S-box protein [uncultured Methanospirillum sp.]
MTICPIYIFSLDSLIGKNYKKPEKTEKGYTGSTTCTINGVKRTFWVKATRFSDPKGNLSGAIESIRDTTKRVKLLHTLQNSRNHFENIIEHLPDPTFAIDKNGSVIAWNRAMELFTGNRKAEILGATDRAYASAIYGDKRDTLVDYLVHGASVNYSRYTSVEVGRCVISGYACIPSSFQTGDRIVWVVAGMLSDQEGQPYGAIVTIRDISHIMAIEEELKKKQETLESSYEELAVSQEELRESYETLYEWKRLLEESELKYRTLVENSNDAVFLIQDSRYIYVNPTCSTISGYSEGDLYDLDIWKTITPADRPALRSQVQMVMNGITGHLRYETSIQAKDGSTKMVEFVFARIQYNGRTALLGRGRDVTDRIRAERALIQANQKLHLLSSITRHDIKNHLTSLQAALSIVNEYNTGEDTEVLLNIANRSVQNIDQAISFTALYQDIGISEPVWSDLQESFSSYADLARSADIEFHILLTFPVEVSVDPLFSRVCYNLIENCIRHGGSVKTITVSSHMSGDILLIHIADDGEGVADDEKKKIFLRGHGRNTGMGLFLVREILKITEIEISEIGRKGEGAIFEMVIPSGRYRHVSISQDKTENSSIINMDPLISE